MTHDLGRGSTKSLNGAGFGLPFSHLVWAVRNLANHLVQSAASRVRRARSSSNCSPVLLVILVNVSSQAPDESISTGTGDGIEIQR